MTLLAVDPGRDKCGLALLREDGSVAHRSVVIRSELVTALTHLAAGATVDEIVIGSGTTGREVTAILREAVPGRPIHVVDETESTMEARRLYFAENPPRGVWRLVPETLQMPPRPVDDYAAVILGRRFLRSRRAAGPPPADPSLPR